MVMQGRREFIEKWLQEDKLECTEELGDVVRAPSQHYQPGRGALQDETICVYAFEGIIQLLRTFEVFLRVLPSSTV